MSFHYGEKTKLVPFSNICSDLNYYHKTKRSYRLDFNFVTWQQKNGKIINLNLVSWVSSTFIISHSLLDFSSPFVLLLCCCFGSSVWSKYEMNHFFKGKLEPKYYDKPFSAKYVCKI